MGTFPLKEMRNRHEVICYFDGYTSERFEELTEKKLRRPLTIGKKSTLRASGRTGGNTIPNKHPGPAQSAGRVAATAS